MGLSRTSPADLEHDDNDVSNADDLCRVDDDFGGADIDDISDDYPILDDDSPVDDNPDDGSLDDNLAAFIDDLNAVLDYFYNAGPDDDDIVNGSDEPHTPGEHH